MSPPPIFDTAGVDRERALGLLADAVSGADDGELYLERSESEALLFDDGRLKSAAYDSTEGFGLRVVAGETTGYAHASEVSQAAIGRAAASAAAASTAVAVSPWNQRFDTLIRDLVDRGDPASPMSPR